jgi:hypothetical protein
MEGKDMKLLSTVVATIAFAFSAPTHACVSLQLIPFADLSQKGIQIKVVDYSDKANTFRFTISIDKDRQWTAATLSTREEQSTTFSAKLAATEQKDGSRTFSFIMSKAAILKSKLTLSYGAKGDDGHYRGSSTTIDLYRAIKSSDSSNP